MPIEPFKIINDDGTTNQSEYERCIEFLNKYIDGDVQVFTTMTWTNPLEVDLSQTKSAYKLITELLNLEDNRLLTKDAFNNIKKLIIGMLDRYGSTIHTYGKYLEQSANFTDGPGYMYDVCSKDETPVLKEEIDSNVVIYYLDDDNHTVLEYNDYNYNLASNNEFLPTCNFPSLSLTSNKVTSNISDCPHIYKGNLCGVYSDFQRLSGQYVGTSTLFYFSECKDQMYTTGGNAYSDSRLNEVINFNFNNHVGNKLQPTKGIDLSTVASVQGNVVNPSWVNAYVPYSYVNSDITYLTPTNLTAKNDTDWIY